MIGEMARARELLIGAENGWTATIWVEGPREWSPRKRLVEESVELIHRAIPKKLLLSRREVGRFMIGEEDYHVDGTFTIPGRKGVIAKIVLMARLPLSFPSGEGLGLVWLRSDGKLSVRKEVIDLLRGKMPGHEHLAGRWPWGEALGPVVELVGAG